MSEFIGKSVSDGRFLIERELGRGGTGVVLEAEDLLLKRQVAIKIITSQSEVSAQRFEREVRTLAAVKCQYIPEIFTWGRTDEGLPFIVMELLDHTTLESLLATKNVLPDTDVCAIAIEITKALSIIHDAEIVHRDLKPSNVMVQFDSDEGWSIKLLDFGLVHLLAQDQRLTQTDNVLGSIGYFSPEHATPHSIDCRSDIFSLGCILFRSLTGEPPFEAENLFASILLMNSDIREKIPPSIPTYLKEIVAKCLYADPSKRFQNAAELRKALESKQTPETIAQACSQRSRTSIKLAFLASLGLVVIACCSKLSIIHQNSSSFSPELTPAQSLHSVAKSKNLKKQREFLQKLSTNDEFWNHSSTQHRDDLKAIAAAQFTSGDIAGGELAFKCILQSLSARKAPKEEWIDAYHGIVGRYMDSDCLNDKAVVLAKEAVRLSANFPFRQKHSYFLLATIYQTRGEIENTLSAYEHAHQIKTDSAPNDGDVLDGEIATKYARFLNKNNKDPKKVLQLIAFAILKFNEALDKERVLDYERFEDLYVAISEVKDQSKLNQLFHEASSLMSRGSRKIADTDRNLQVMAGAATLKLKYDKTGALHDVREVMKIAKEKRAWKFVVSAATVLAECKIISSREISELMNKSDQMPPELRSQLKTIGEKLKG